jgi:hypothetical protein
LLVPGCSVFRMELPPAMDGPVPLQSPPPERLRDRLRRRVRALGAYTGMRHWILVRGLALTAAFAALFVANGIANGWKTAYDVTIGITSPGETGVAVPTLAWFLSVAGWLAAPAIFGAVIGTVIGITIADRRRRSISEVLTKDGDVDE